MSNEMNVRYMKIKKCIDSESTEEYFSESIKLIILIDFMHGLFSKHQTKINPPLHNLSDLKLDFAKNLKGIVKKLHYCAIVQYFLDMQITIEKVNLGEAYDFEFQFSQAKAQIEIIETVGLYFN